MKQTFLLLSAVFALSACSGDDNDSKIISDAYNPPVWIQGTWGIAASDFTAETPLYKFESDNICQLVNNGVSSLCWKEAAAQYKSMKIDYVAADTETASTYEVKLGAAGSTVTLQFEKVSATTIKWTNGNNAVLTKLK